MSLISSSNTILSFLYFEVQEQARAIGDAAVFHANNC